MGFPYWTHIKDGFFLQYGSILDLDDVHPDSAKCINLEKSIGKNDFPYHFNKIIVR